MAIYRFGPDSLIDQVHVIKNSAGGERAYLHARAGATAEQLSAIHEQCLLKDWIGVPYSAGGEHYLEVRGFSDAEELKQELAGHGWIKGAPTVKTTPNEVVSLRDKFRAMSLKLSGFVYIAGDAAYLTYAGMRRFHAKTKADRETGNLLLGAGVGYGLGSIVLSKFGGKDQSRAEIKIATDRIQAYLIKEGIEPAPDSTMGHILEKRERPLTHRLSKFFSRYPSEILNTIYTGVGLLMMAASFKSISQEEGVFAKAREITENIGAKFKEHKQQEGMDIGLGAITAASSLAGLIIKEKKPAEGVEKRHGLGRIIDWIQEKPLRATGYGYMIATAFHAGGSYLRYKQGDVMERKTIIPRVAFVITNLAAEVLMAISSKGHGDGVVMDDSIEKTVVASTAEMISRQPVEKQQELVNRLSGYLGAPGMFGSKAEKIAEEMQNQLTAIRQNPWIRVAVVPQAPAPSSEPTTHVTSAVHLAKPKEAMPVIATPRESWQEETLHQAAQASAVPALG